MRYFSALLYQVSRTFNLTVRGILSADLDDGDRVTVRASIEPQPAAIRNFAQVGRLVDYVRLETKVCQTMPTVYNPPLHHGHSPIGIIPKQFGPVSGGIRGCGYHISPGPLMRSSASRHSRCRSTACQIQ